MQGETEALARLAGFHHQTWNDGDEHLSENPEFPHGAVVQLEAQEIQANIKTEQLNAYGLEHLASGGARLEIDALLIGTGSLQTEYLHSDPNGFAELKVLRAKHGPYCKHNNDDTTSLEVLGGGYMPMDLTEDSKVSRSPRAPFLILAR